MKSEKVGVIGLGYVGLPLCISFAKANFQVIGFDIDKEKVKTLKAKKSYLKHIEEEEIKFLHEKSFIPTTDFSLLREVDLISICVPTPLDKHKNPDLQYIISTTNTIAQYLKKGQTVVLESTTYPGTTREVVLKILEEKTSLQVGKDFYLAYSPEREDPGRKDFKGSNIPRVIGGITPICLEKACYFYEKAFEKIIRVSSVEVAEMTKLLENIYRSINIALVNELKLVAHRMGINIWEVIEAASTKPFGFQAFYPGPGLGGHCIPIDPFYLSYKAKEYDITPHFIELAGEINTYMPYWIVEQTILALNKRNISISKSHILLIGIAYKKDVDDLRESPALKIWKILEEKGAKVDYYDPYIPEVPHLRNYNFKKKCVKLTEDILKKYEGVIIVTNHSNIDYEFICKHSKLVIDTRNATKNIVNKENIVLI